MTFKELKFSPTDMSSKAEVCLPNAADILYALHSPEIYVLHIHILTDLLQ